MGRSLDHLLTALVEHDAEGPLAGIDRAELQQMAGHGPEENRRHGERFAELLRALYEFPRPTIAAVQGPALAGGAGVILACGFVVAAGGARFGFSEGKGGLGPGIVSAFLVREGGGRDGRGVMVDGRLEGIVSIGDVVKARLGEIEHETEALREYIVQA